MEITPKKETVNLRQKTVVVGIDNKDKKLIAGQRYKVATATAQNLIECGYALSEADYEKRKAEKPAAQAGEKKDK